MRRRSSTGTFHYFDWQKTDRVGVSIGTCPQIVSSETARIGITVGNTTRMLPFDEGETFAEMIQRITPLTTVLEAADPQFPLEATFTFRSAFYPQSFEYSCAPGYMIEVRVTNTGQEVIEADVFFGLKLPMGEVFEDGFRAVQPIMFPDGIDHEGIDGLTFEQVIAWDNTLPQPLTVGTDGESAVGLSVLTIPVRLEPGETKTINFYHAVYIAQPTLNRRGTS
jgi:hypothetical protein